MGVIVRTGPNTTRDPILTGTKVTGKLACNLNQLSISHILRLNSSSRPSA
jgi:hypothetical protein